VGKVIISSHIIIFHKTGTALVVEGLSLSLSGSTLPLWAVFSLIMTGHYQHWDENMIYGCH